jgi:hypothetical protein
VPQLDVPMLLIGALVLAAWSVVSLVVLAVCRIAAKADAEMTEDRGFAVDESCLRLISQPSPREDMADGAQEDLDIGPERPVGHVQVVDRSHLA